MVDFYLGQIIQFGGNFAIKGTATCDGQLLSLSQNTALFAILGTTYGGNGTSNFALPDLRGRRPIHNGQGSGLSQYDLGEQIGAETVTLLTGNLPSHNHTLTSSFDVSGAQPHATLSVPSAGVVLGHPDDISGNRPKALPAIYCPAGTTLGQPLASLNVAAAAPSGSGQPLGILEPYLVITMLIWLQGIFPPRN